MARTIKRWRIESRRRRDKHAPNPFFGNLDTVEAATWSEAVAHFDQRVLPIFATPYNIADFDVFEVPYFPGPSRVVRTKLREDWSGDQPEHEEIKA